MKTGKGWEMDTWICTVIAILIVVSTVELLAPEIAAGKA